MTLKRYLDAVQTFTPSDQLATTSAYVQEFGEDKPKIEAINKLLQEKFDQEENWVLDILKIYFEKLINF